jgi:CBS domain-containing protein
MPEEGVRREEYRVTGDALLEKVKELIHEGNIRRIIVKDKDGKTLLDIPLTIGVLGVLVAPQLAALGALAALVGDATLVVEIIE